MLYIYTTATFSSCKLTPYEVSCELEIVEQTCIHIAVTANLLHCVLSYWAQMNRYAAPWGYRIICVFSVLFVINKCVFATEVTSEIKLKRQETVVPGLSFIEIESRVRRGLKVEDFEYRRLDREKKRIAAEIASFLFEKATLYRSGMFETDAGDHRKPSTHYTRGRHMLSLESYPEIPSTQGNGQCAKEMDNWMSTCIFDDY